MSAAVEGARHTALHHVGIPRRRRSRGSAQSRHARNVNRRSDEIVSRRRRDPLRVNWNRLSIRFRARGREQVSDCEGLIAVAKTRVPQKVALVRPPTVRAFSLAMSSCCTEP